MKKNIKKIAYEDNCVRVENLPLPYVYYPGFYGSFFGFSEKANADIFMCECSRPAIENYIYYRLNNRTENTIKEKNFIISSNDFPISFVRKLMDIGSNNVNEIKKYIKYKEKLCHQCNKAIPDLRYCHKMYGGLFKQTYGWYIKRKFFEVGLAPLSYRPFLNQIPDEIMDLIEIEPEEYFNIREKHNLDGKNNELNEFDKRWEKQKRRIYNVIENKVRSLFGYKEIGSAWAGETTLYNIIVNNFKGYDIIRHYRPKILDYLELDIYIPEKKIGIEYQGQQHYIPIKHWGGEAALEKTIARDKKKIKLCLENKIKLLHIKYDEPLVDDYIMKKIRRKLVEYI